MNVSVELNDNVEDSATLRRLGIAVGCMCIGALMLVATAVTVGNLLG
jgi:hypothetical protein